MFKASLSGLFQRIQDILHSPVVNHADQGDYLAHCLGELEEHLQMVRTAAEAGDMDIVHEFLEFYTFEGLAPYKRPGSAPSVKVDKEKTLAAFHRLIKNVFGEREAKLSIPAEADDDDLVVGDALRALFDTQSGYDALHASYTALQTANDTLRADNDSLRVGANRPPDEKPKAWDHEIVWDNDQMGSGVEWSLPLTDDPNFKTGILTLISTVWPALTDHPDIRAMGMLPGMIRVWGLAPEGGGPLMVQATGPDAHGLLEMMDDDQAVMIRLGWAHPEALERLPDFEGW